MENNGIKRRALRTTILLGFLIPLLISGNYLYQNIFEVEPNTSVSETSEASEDANTTSPEKENESEVEVESDAEAETSTESSEEVGNTELFIVAEQTFKQPYSSEHKRFLEDAYKTLYFSPQSFKIVEDDNGLIDEFISIAVQFPDELISIEGHANGYPNFENSILEQSLSEERIKSVAKYMISRGIPEERLKFYNCGSSQPLTLEADLQNDNDRVEIYFESFNAKGQLDK